ncbi:MAG: hypothetical protein GWN93_06810 [Deltaproteobacteria bacterium]|nr:hypothetical protein [Deltaproteobacteria bacterium]
MTEPKPETYRGVKFTVQQVGHGWRYDLPSGARGVGLASKKDALTWAHRSIDQEQEPQQ